MVPDKRRYVASWVEHKAPGNGVMTRGQALLKRLPGDCWRLTPGE